MNILRQYLPSGNALIVFEAVARHLNISKAAKELRVSQPAVSKMIRNMEETLGSELFIRQSSGLTLTDKGEQLVQVVEPSFAAIGKVVKHISRDNTQEASKTVTLSITAAMATYWIIPKLDDFRKEHSEIDLQFLLIDSEPSGTLGEADLGVRLITPEDMVYETALLIHEEVIPVCSPDYLEKYGPLENPETESGHTLLRVTEPRVTWRQFFDGQMPFDVINARRLTFSNYSVLLQTAISGQGVALGWLDSNIDLLMKGILVPASERKIKTGRHYSIHSSTHKIRQPHVRQVRDWIVREMKKDLQLYLNQFKGELAFGKSNLPKA